MNDDQRDALAVAIQGFLWAKSLRHPKNKGETERMERWRKIIGWVESGHEATIDHMLSQSALAEFEEEKFQQQVMI